MFVSLTAPTLRGQQSPGNPDVVIVGAGIAGLSAAFEAGRHGMKVLVVDLWSIWGGHATVAGGVTSIVGTPFQKAKEINDSPDLAFQDFVDWGGDPDKEWLRYYVENSNREIYEWLTGMGVVFNTVQRNPGNSVARVHVPNGGGLAEVLAIYRECLKYPNITYLYNLRITGLIVENQRVAGVAAQNMRDGKTFELRAPAVVLATGGFQSNLDMVREFWPKSIRFPEQILTGSSPNAVGSGHKLAGEVGAALSHMDHQWNYSTGIRDPRYPGSKRGLRARTSASIWVNSDGKRFVNESESFKVTVPAVANQKGSSYWTIFDEAGKKLFTIGGTPDWENPTQTLFQKFPDAVESADSVEALARAIGVDAATLAETVRRFNAMVDKGADEDFRRFGPDITKDEEKAREAYVPFKLDKPPFYAVQTFDLTRKSMGGVGVDLSCRVLDKSGRPIPGLYAVGEVTGFAGINGKAGLEGTFLGPSMVTGRVGGRAVAADLKFTSLISVATPVVETKEAGTPVSNDACQNCHALDRLVGARRAGFEHFERAHQAVLERQFDCVKCHAEFAPVRMESHRFSRPMQANNCAFCH